MAGGVIRSYKDRVVEDILQRDFISRYWNLSNAGQGVIVKNAFKDFPAIGQGDPTVETPSNAYYKWDGSAFLKISEGEGLDNNNSGSSVYDGASPSTIALGGIPANTNLQGRTHTSLWEQALVVFQQPDFNSFSIVGQATTIEIGDSIFSGNKNFTWATTNNGNIKPDSITIRNQTSNQDLGSNLPNNGSALINIATSIQLNVDGQTQIFRITLENTNNEIRSRDFTVTARYKRFFGSPAVAPSGSVQVRALSGSTYGSTMSIIIPQGNLIAAFAYEATRPDIVDSSVKYVEGFNSNVGSTFVKSLITVQDAGGTNRSYKLFIATLGAAFPAQATYNITIP